MEKQRAILIAAIIILLTIIFFTNSQEPKITACTSDAKICPDGSAVGRTGPDCEFAECPKTNETYCEPEQRNIDACIEIYQPVCGWNNPENIQCITYPCASTYSNYCFACQNPDVEYYTLGECPSTNFIPDQ
ncbi:hypothetical protein HN604_01040 [archaeon]|jgi:hypothetical protein|nr:hypothetical protein [archaeon]MBT6182696.1 hypothetical protein [archaeon]MBT6606707.1 hypothetical protein [archaeon]MBT7251950.1 hypothetical protein [archaeon]MBT7660649.1 hypothetical protein [archaeon]